MDVSEAIMTRRSSRSFSERPVSKETILSVLSAAARAPSAINLQPWEFTVLGGEERPRLSRALVKAFKERGVGCGTGASRPLPEHIKERQYSSFLGLSKLLEADTPEVQRFINEGSLDFYGAPTVIIITKEKFFPDQYLLSDGIMIGYLLLAAHNLGLSTCPIGLVNAYEGIILDFINLEDRDLVLAVALGYGDPEAPVNRLATPREPVENLVRWFGIR